MKTKKRASKLSRRSFLKLAGGTALAGTALGLNGFSDLVKPAEAASEMGTSQAVLVDIPKCIGCESCSVACKMANGLEWNQKDQVKTAKEHGEDPGKGLVSGIWTSINLYEPEIQGKATKRFVKTQCFHCNEPACVSACFSKALQKTPDGPVVYDQTLCVGCRYCMLACPFDIIRYEWEKSIPGISKCQMCEERLKDGLEPACVSVCPEGALKFGKREDLLKEARSRIADNGDVNYVDHIYGEKEVGGTSWLYISDVPFEQMRFRTENLPEQSIPSYTETYVTATPLFGAAWAAVLGALYFLRNKNKKGAREE